MVRLKFLIDYKWSVITITLFSCIFEAHFLLNFVQVGKMNKQRQCITLPQENWVSWPKMTGKGLSWERG